MDMHLVGKQVVVTGASKGIGLAIVEALIEEGAAVVAAARHVDALPAEVQGVAVDLSTPEGASELVAAAAEIFDGGLDVLVNNVGVAQIRTLEQVDDAQWQAAWDTNVMSYVRCIRAALPHLRESGHPAIVNVSSTSGKRPSASMPEYSVTKAALLSLSRLVADVHAGDGIRCNAVTPGPTRSPAWLAPGGLADQSAAVSGKDRDQVLESVAAGRPLKRMAEPEEIAAVIAFLCSPRSSYVTGAAWSADGGTVPVIL